MDPLGGNNSEVKISSDPADGHILSKMVLQSGPERGI